MVIKYSSVFEVVACFSILCILSTGGCTAGILDLSLHILYDPKWILVCICDSCSCSIIGSLYPCHIVGIYIVHRRNHRFNQLCIRHPLILVILKDYSLPNWWGLLEHIYPPQGHSHPSRINTSLYYWLICIADHFPSTVPFRQNNKIQSNIRYNRYLPLPCSLDHWYFWSHILSHHPSKQHTHYSISDSSHHFSIINNFRQFVCTFSVS